MESLSNGAVLFLAGSCFVLAIALYLARRKAKKDEDALFMERVNHEAEETKKAFERLKREAEEFDRRRNNPSDTPKQG